MKTSLLLLASLLKLATMALAAPTVSGSLTAVTMNVAGLPSILNSNGDSDKKANSIAIGKKFAQYNYNLINVQEVRADRQRKADDKRIADQVMSRLHRRTSIITLISTTMTTTRIALPRRAACHSGPG